MVAAPLKPLTGAPCNGCGLCCLTVQCPISELIFGLRLRCPAIEGQADGTMKCGLIASPASYFDNEETAPVLGETIAVLLGAGQGCDAVSTDEDFIAFEAIGPQIKARTIAAVENASPQVREVIKRMGVTIK